MKQYIKPQTSLIMVNSLGTILAGSGGVETGGVIGDSYTSTDVSYSRRRNNWNDDEDDE